MKKNLRQFVVVFLLILIILSLFYKPFNRSLRSLISRPTRGIRAVLFQTSSSIEKNFSFIFNIKNLRSENEDLARKLQALQVDESQINELTTENKLLKQEIGFVKENEEGSLVPARIIQRDPVAFLDNIIIDKGSDDGVAPKMAVVYNGVLVGQVSVVYKTTSKVTLITSKDSMVQAMLQDSRANGLLKGGLSGLYLDNIVLDTQYKTGENVITSGLGGDIRQGILIGTAGKMQSYSSGIFESIEVNPLVDFSKLEIVFV